MDYSLPGSSIHEILQAIILEWTAMLSSRGSSSPRDRTHVSMPPALAGRFFTTTATWGWGEMVIFQMYSQSEVSKMY